MRSIQFVKTVNTAAGQCISLVNEIIDSENTPKEVVKSFIDMANMAKGMMDENQQLSVEQEFERLFPSTRGGGKGGESRELHRVGAGDPSASKQLILVSQHRVPQHERLQKYGDKKLVETRSKFAIFSM